MFAQMRGLGDTSCLDIPAFDCLLLLFQSNLIKKFTMSSPSQNPSGNTSVNIKKLLNHFLTVCL